MPRSSKWPLSFRFYKQNFAILLPLTRHMYHSTKLNSADDPNHIWQTAWLLSRQTIKAFSFPVTPKLKLFKLLHTRGFSKRCIAHLISQDTLIKLADFCVAK